MRIIGIILNLCVIAYLFSTLPGIWRLMRKYDKICHNNHKPSDSHD